MEREVRFKVGDDLDTEVRKAAWLYVGKSPNGELEEATFYWPSDVREAFAAITKTTRQIRKQRCTCKKKKEKPACAPIEATALQVLSGLKISNKNAREIAHALARFAHARRVDDGSPD